MGKIKVVMIDGGLINTVPIDDDFEMVLECAERYAIGRHSYLPPDVIEYIASKLRYISDNCLMVIDSDLTEEFNRYDRMNWQLSYKQEWQELLNAVRAELEKRKE